MATYLELCQQVAAESGTVSGVQPSTVTGNVGRLALIVQHVRDAWVEIQVSRDNWRFMRKTFSGDLTAGTLRYTPASFNLTDLASWVTDNISDFDDDALSLYKTSAGRAGEGAIQQIDWARWRRLYDRGTHDANRPVAYAISPANELCVGPTPDAAYTVRGEYYRTPQRLADNGDVPIMPERYHTAIVWKALTKLGSYDESEWPVTYGRNEFAAILDDLLRDQTPPTGVDWEPLA